MFRFAGVKPPSNDSGAGAVPSRKYVTAFVCRKGGNVRARRGFEKVRLRGKVGAGAERSPSPGRMNTGSRK